MVGKTQYSDIEITINKLADDDKEGVKSFSCGCDELNSFFHNEVYLCSKHHYVSAYCVKDKFSRDVLAIFTLSNDSVVINSDDDKEDFISEKL